MANNQIFTVDVICAHTDRQKVISVTVTTDTSFIEAVRLSGIMDYFPEIDLDTVKLGCFSKVVKHHDKLAPGMRVEIYRPLIADPKEVRRRRAAQAKTKE